MTFVPAGVQEGIELLRNRRLPLVLPLLCYAFGIIVGDQSWIPVEWMTGLAALFLVAAIVRPFRFLLLVGIFLTGGAVQSWQIQNRPGDRLSAEPGWIEARGQVIAEPKPYGTTGEKFRVVTRLQSFSFANREEWRLPLSVLVIWKGRVPPAYGDEIEVRGVLRRVSPPRNPGAFNYAQWLSREGIEFELEPRAEAECQVLSSGHGNPFFRFALASREWIGQAITAGLEPGVASALIRAMTLGETEDVPIDIREDFQLSGTLHVFSVSGLHVAMLALIVWQMVSLLRLPRSAQCLVVIAVIFFYALVTGWNPPSVRAAIMTACLILAMVWGRQSQPFNLLAGAALWILLLNPAELFNVGFQLSFVVVGTILALARPFQHTFERGLMPDPWLPRPLYSKFQEGQWLAARHFGSLLGVSLAASLGSLILTAYHFHFISMVAPVVNLVVVPLSFLLLCLATLGFLVFGISPWLAGTFAQTNELVAILILWLVEAAAHLPGASTYVGPPVLPPLQARIMVLDAGRGGAAVIQTRSQTWVLDTGNEFFFRHSLLPYLRSRGIGRVQGLLLSHGDSNHVGGALSAMEELRPPWGGISGMKTRSPVLKRLASEFPAQQRTVASGDRWELGEGIWLEVLALPVTEEIQRADDACLVFRLIVGEFSLLLTSDIGYPTEDELLGSFPEKLRATVWIKGQHGSGGSGRDSFLMAVNPRAVIATSADFPEQERASPDWLRYLESRGIRTFNQAQTGAVWVDIFPDRMEIRAFLNGEFLEIRQ